MRISIIVFFLGILPITGFAASSLEAGYGRGPNFSLSRSTSFEMTERSSSATMDVLLRVVEIERLFDELEEEAERIEQEIARLTPQSCSSDKKITWDDAAGYDCDTDQTRELNASAPPTSPPGECRLPWGGTLVSGQSVQAFQAASVAFGETCSEETRTCTNGRLTGSFTNQTCEVDPCGCTEVGQAYQGGKCAEIGPNALIAETADRYLYNWYTTASQVSSLCTNIGAGWYAPTRSDLWVLYRNRTAIGGFTPDPYFSGEPVDGRHLTSRAHELSPWVLDFSYGDARDAWENHDSGINFRVRCVKRVTCGDGPVIPIQPVVPTTEMKSCAREELSWGFACRGRARESAHGTKRMISNSTANWGGRVLATCNDGKWSVADNTNGRYVGAEGSNNGTSCFSYNADN